MSTITKEFTKEQLQQIIETDHVQCGEASALARIALASLEAQPVGEIVLGEYDDCGCHPDARVVCTAADGQAEWENFKDGTRLFTAPPAPVSVPDFGALTKCIVQRLVDYGTADDEAIASAEEFVYNACRTAMLQGAEPVTTAYKLGNSPVIQDGYVLVPVEPTEDMIIHGFESEPDESFSDADVWEAYESMSGCQQAAHRAKLCWAAMIAAAPKPDVR
ncbi:hypothetical protein ACY03_08745 [Salmonella enterica subsp. enterica serovar Senftenberg]|uniref:hypothetical protein n=1 Tax=Salmonella enterica TaxID=28901 RepID=UPI00107A9F6B|nr:hypothetical protein [Salmonella enterica subsp. enterica serovar Senftenberg]ECO0750015.1 hypothetical protein [Salmonella enterica subsp. enterica serovar Senftenberg]ECO1270406.1 hypothetical protein [Salmonella enterica subsp. enterica serovar Senftenberg]